MLACLHEAERFLAGFACSMPCSKGSRYFIFKMLVLVQVIVYLYKVLHCECCTVSKNWIDSSHLVTLYDVLCVCVCVREREREREREKGG